MYRLVPFAIELLVSSRIPPILVELPMRKLSNFSKNIRDTFKYNIE